MEGMQSSTILRVAATEPVAAAVAMPIAGQGHASATLPFVRMRAQVLVDDRSDHSHSFCVPRPELSVNIGMAKARATLAHPKGFAFSISA
jgi:hypothetical protein